MTNPRPDVAARSDGGSENCVIPWYRQVKETKRGGRDGRKSQCLDSTVEAGEQSPVRTPGREARHREHGLVVGTYDGYLEIRCTYYTKQQRIAELARRSPQMGFTSLAYLMDIDWLIAAFHRTRKDGAPGVDGQTWSDYEKNLEANLQSLLDRAKSGTYRAPPVRRVYIPKAGSATETRPIGIPTLEDKVLQRAVVMLLEPIYEQDFDAGSYGFRPGRSAHDALEDLWKRTMDSSGGWILEVDIRKFFDTLGSCPSAGVSSTQGT